MKRITNMFVVVFLIVLTLMLAGCSISEDSFSSGVTRSHDNKFYAVQTLTKPENAKVNYVQVTVYDSETDEAVDSFLTERATDFWGICWEADTYNIWVQSGDIGTYCMIWDNGVWRRDVYTSIRCYCTDGVWYQEADYPRHMPDGMIDRFRMRNGSFEYIYAYSRNTRYCAGRGSRPEEVSGSWIDGIDICEMSTGRIVFFYPLDLNCDFRGVCWERENDNLWVRVGDDAFCLRYDDGSWIRDDNLTRPEYIALAYNWDGTIKN
ncbi:MAG: hypothetical protein IJJ23_01280 [Clostridia bacterium]|nr:hypothetical protein [Clostridia bacterium]